MGISVLWEILLATAGKIRVSILGKQAKKQMRQQVIENKGNNEKWKCQISDFKWNINKMNVINIHKYY